MKKLIIESHPNISSLWDFEKNIDVNINKVTPGSGKKIWWRCKEGHSWERAVDKMVKGPSCPYCTGIRVDISNCLLSTHPKIAELWHPIKNTTLKPTDVKSGSNKKVYWICALGHESYAPICNKVRNPAGTCKECANLISKGKIKLSKKNITIFDTHPDLAGQWNLKKNKSLTPKCISRGNTTEDIWWICSRGHEWIQTVHSRVKSYEYSIKRGVVCPCCDGNKLSHDNSLAHTHPETADEWHPTKNSNLKPQDVRYGSGKKVWWLCKRGHEWITPVYVRAKKDRNTGKYERGSGCPGCNNSVIEIIISKYIRLVFPSSHKYSWHDTTTINGYEYNKEFDVVIPEYSIAIEIDGYFHKNRKNEDIQKNKDAKNMGINLLRFRMGMEKLNSEQDFEAKNKNNKDDCINFLFFIVKHVNKIDNKFYEKNKILLDEIRLKNNEYYSKFLNDAYYESNEELLKNCYISRYVDIDKNKQKLFCLSTASVKMEKKIWWKCEKGHSFELSVVSVVNSYKKTKKLSCCYCNRRQVCNNSSLDYTHPNVAKEWHPTKNMPLTTLDVFSGSSHRVWWKCKVGHEWQATIGNRALNKTGCPFCSGRKLDKNINSLLVKRPEIAKLWHPEKNDISARDVSPGMNKLAWWICDRGHEYQAIINSKSYNCSICIGKKAHLDNCLEKINPILSRQWHPTKNGNITPKDVVSGSSKIFFWLCEKGHEWEARVGERQRKTTGCPYCSGRRVCKDNSLRTNNPQLTREWHPDKNINITPDDVTCGSGKKVWWKCKEGHEWDAVIASRIKNGCPFCSGLRTCMGNSLASKKPHIAREWDDTKNNKLSPKDVSCGSNRKVWWICAKGHKWEAVIAQMVRNKHRCVKCKKEKELVASSVAAKIPKVIEQWHPEKNNKTPYDVFYGAKKRVWWKCKYGHEWSCPPYERIKSGCPYCSGKRVCKDNSLRTKNPQLTREWHPDKNINITPDDVTCGSSKKVWWKCEKGHEWLTTIGARALKKTKCPYCSGRRICKENSLRTH